MARIILALAALFAAIAPAAHAAQLSADADGITFTAAPGEVNTVEVTLVRHCRNTTLFVVPGGCTPGQGTQVVDRTAGIEAGDGCLAVDEHTAICGLDGADYHRATLTLGDRDDNATASDGLLRASVDAGAGDDVVLASGAVTSGGPGNDRLTGGTEIHGDDGDDVIEGGVRSYGGAGADRMVGGGAMDGGPGSDTFPSSGTVVYDGRTAPVTVTLDGVANDGERGEGDNVTTYGVRGGPGDDVLVGDDRSNQLSGGSGDDVLRGGGAADSLTGGEGDDTIAAEAGDDILVLDDPGADVFSGGDGYDWVMPQAPESLDGIRLLLDRRRNDGPAPFVDRVEADVERLYGTDGDDVIVTGAGAQVVYPNCGSDRVTTGDGDDQIYGFCSGTDGMVTFDGGAGNDVINDPAGPGDVLRGGAGNDSVSSSDGQVDDIACGTDVDNLWVDLAETVPADCENVTNP